MAKTVQYARMGLLSLIGAGLMVTHAMSSFAQTPEITEKLRNLIELKPPADEGEGGSRGAASSGVELICAISPTRDTDLDTLTWLEPEVIWSDRPLFLWQPKIDDLVIQSIQVLRDDTEEIIWESPVAATQNFIIYPPDAPPLQPGVAYIWQLVTDRPYMQATFQILDGAERSSINSQMQAISSQLTGESATPADIALNQALYLGEQELVSDMLKYIYAVDQPSESVQSLQNQIVTQFCPSDS
ncbi:hypothetical protein [Roseofilum capinflatum]|uniref:DUF928 domain-containing protein n=1 Tax=Roseofilum capinflatum BLCC-M114 TaxID=3022440 RepID=A0ABT7B990_9CYAN|nr:hypothetical protein [Roseofilum capinflatum]MDJ1175734.1 hypothetical protein [Roseofilum capinflatum BLCC-M114]